MVRSNIPLGCGGSGAVPAVPEVRAAAAAAFVMGGGVVDDGSPNVIDEVPPGGACTLVELRDIIISVLIFVDIFFNFGALVDVDPRDEDSTDKFALNTL